jgi:N-methylhydantoinase A
VSSVHERYDSGLRIAVDIGGTFVDAIEFDPIRGTARLTKSASTPASPAQGVLTAIGALMGDLGSLDTFIHGTTLGLNAVLERRGATTGLITNDGFRDLLEIGRSDVPFEHMYDFRYVRPRPLVPRRRTRGVRGRIDYRGRELEPLDEAAVIAVARELIEEHHCTSIAICFLHSYANPAHERCAVRLIRDAWPDLTVSASVDVSPEYREYERLSTTVVDAFVSPIFGRYVDDLERGLEQHGHRGRFLITRSAGGAMTADAARQTPSLTLLSGPAGGIIGATAVARSLGRSNLIAFDVGGTSLDACVIVDGHPTEVYEARIEQLPLLIPVYDIRTIGAGGGSIASIRDGLLEVGPESAGADPGPAAYGRGSTRPTVTDAAIVLGYIDPSGFVGGSFQLDVDAAVRAVESAIAEPLGRSVPDAASAILDVLLARTVGAVREITVERGMDPREFTLLAYGGAGPLVATGLARDMGIAEILVPRMPAGFSAWGMLMADLEHDVAATILAPLDAAPTLADVANRLSELTDRADAALAGQGVPSVDRRTMARLDLRYQGQGHVLEVPIEPGDGSRAIAERFHALHSQRYGHRLESGIEVVTLRVRGIGSLPKPSMPPFEPQPAEAFGTRHAYDLATRSMREFQVVHRETLTPDTVIAGPLLVTEDTAVTVVHGDQHVFADAFGMLHVGRQS